MNILLDSDFIIALNVDTQSTHKEATKIFERISEANLFITNLVKIELVTVASKKFTADFAKEMYMLCNDINNIWIDTKADKEIWREFLKYNTKNISYIDCANLVVAKQNEMKIASFDKFYPKKLLI